MAAREKDAVDRIVEQWRRERSDLDLEAMELFARIGRLSTVGERAVEANLKSFGLTIGEFDVLAALRRAGPPYELTPGDLIRTLMRSSGGMTHRIDRLEAAGLVERRPDPTDGRVVRVALTRRGRERIDAAVGAHVANEARLLSVLSASERAALGRIVRKLLRGLEAEEAWRAATLERQGWTTTSRRPVPSSGRTSCPGTMVAWG